MSKKLTYEFIKEQFEKRGYTLISYKYNGNSEKLDYTCDKHGLKSISYNKLKQGRGCNECGRERTTVSNAHNINDVIQMFAERGYILLETEFINNKKPMRYLCPTHGEKTICLSSLKSGTGCSQCGDIATMDKLKTPYEEVKEAFKDRGYVLISKEYINKSTPLVFICPTHGEMTISYSSLTRGSECFKCAHDKMSGENNFNWKGGTTELYDYLRKLLSDWKQQSLIFHNYSCCITDDRRGNFDIHHLYPFNKILEDTMQSVGLTVYKTVSEYTLEELAVINTVFLDNHEKHGYGAVLTKGIHKLFHDIYGYGNNTPQQFQEFRERYDNNEFADQLRPS